MLEQADSSDPTFSVGEQRHDEHRHDEQRAAVVAACADIAGRSILSQSGHGNFSTRLDDDRMLLTPSGLSHGLQADALAVVCFDGRVEQGQLTPATREIVPMHAAVYRARADVGAVVHTHSPNLTAFAVAHQSLPCRYEALLRRGQGDEVPVVPWAPRGSEASTSGIAAALDRHPSTFAVLLENHGVLAFAPSPSSAATFLVAFEEAAGAELRAAALGGGRDFPEGAPDSVRRSMQRFAPGQC